VGKHQRFAGRQAGSDVCCIDFVGDLVGGEHHDNVCPLGGIGNGLYFESCLLRLGNGGGIGAEADDDMHAGVFQVERVGMAL